jgi:hypothetical protein
MMTQERGAGRRHNPPKTRRFLMLQLTDSEREKLEWLKANRGERATLVGTIRDLIMKAKN